MVLISITAKTMNDLGISNATSASQLNLVLKHEISAAVLSLCDAYKLLYLKVIFN